MHKIVFHLNCLEQGGAERVVTNLAAQFAEDGYEVLVATEWTADNEFILDEKVRRVHVGLTEQDEKKSRIGKFFARIHNLIRMIETEKPDLVIAFAYKANYRALMATLQSQVPVLISVRTDPVGHYEAPWDKILIPWLYPKAAGCVFQTEGQRDFFQKKIQEKSRIILNPINEKYVGREKVTHRTKEIAHVGRLVDFKNQPLLIRGFAKVHEKYPDYTLKIFGGDSFDGTKEILEHTIRDCHVEDSVKLMGASDDLARETEHAAFFAFTSDWEGLPNVLMEAMALGLPCVATDCPCGGPRTIMEHEKNGLLIPIKDEDALVTAMCRLIEEPEFAEKLGDQARKLGEIANAHGIYVQWKDYVETIIADCTH
ncbi:MAG: glycosyltransferase [Lachnospiraceae bacterium]|nr:glycosyltransferase [Lachnospiraceae bacterium]